MIIFAFFSLHIFTTLRPKKIKNKNKEVNLCCWEVRLSLYNINPLEQTLCTFVMCGSEGVTMAFYGAFLNIHPCGVLIFLSYSAVLVVAWLLPLEAAAISSRILRTP